MELELGFWTEMELELVEEGLKLCFDYHCLESCLLFQDLLLVELFCFLVTFLESLFDSDFMVLQVRQFFRFVLT